MQNKDQLFMTSEEASKKWGLTDRYVSTLCRHGKIPGAVKKENKWFIPKNTKWKKNERKAYPDIKDE